MLENQRIGNPDKTFPMVALTKDGAVLTEANSFVGRELVAVVVFGDGPPSYSAKFLNLVVLPHLIGTAPEELKSELQAVLHKLGRTLQLPRDPALSHAKSLAPDRREEVCCLREFLATLQCAAHAHRGESQFPEVHRQR